MSVGTVSFTKPSLSFRTSVNVPILTDADGDSDETIRLLVIASLSTTILLDALKEQYKMGRSFADDQAAIYHSVETRLEDTHGINGKACVLRFICELQKFPIGDWTIMGELLTALFSPRADGKNLLQEYRLAQGLGREDDVDSCKQYIETCSFGIFEYFDSQDESNIYIPEETNEV